METTVNIVYIFNLFEELIRMTVWPYLQVNDKVSLSMTSKIFEKICIAMNEKQLQQLINIREYGRYKNLCIMPINQIKSINRMLKLFPIITNLIFRSSRKILGEGDKFYASDYWEYLDTRVLSILYSSKQLQNKLLVLSLPIRCGIELKGIGSFTNLTKLEIFGSEIVNDQLCKEMKKLNHLTSLTLNDCPNLTGDFLKNIYKNLCQLTELDLCGCCKIGGFDNWLSGYTCGHFFPSLRILNLSNTMVNYSDFLLICHFNVHLVSLKLDHCPDLNLSGESYFCSRLLELKVLSLKFNKHIRDITFLTVLKSLTSLDLEDCGVQLSLFPNHRLQQLSSLSNLIILNINDCNINDEMVRDDLPVLTNLQILDLSHLNIKTIDIDLSLHRLRMLKSLKLINCRNQYLIKLSFLQYSENITFLDLSYTSVEECEIYRLACLSNLTTLNIDNTFETITHLGFQLLSNLTNLISLSIESNISGNGISQHLSKLCRISILKIAHSSLIDESELVDLSNFSSSLTSLDISGFHTQSESMIKSMIESICSLKALKCLNISSLSDIEDDTILHLSGSLTNLETLILYSCHYFTSTGLSSLSSLVSLKHLLIDDDQFEDSAIFCLQNLSQKGLRIELI